jgi:hypothetical protein
MKLRTKVLNTNTSSKVDKQSHESGHHIKIVMLLPSCSNTIPLTLDFRAGVVKNTDYRLMTCKNGLCTPKVVLIQQSVDSVKP